MFYERKLKHLMMMNGLDFDQLSECLHADEQTLYQMVSGVKEWDSDLLEKVSLILDVDRRFFSARPFIDSGRIDMSEIDFNGAGRDSLRIRYPEFIFLCYLDFFIDRLERPLIIPADRIKMLTDKSDTYTPYDLTDCKIKMLAEHARQYLGVAKNEHVLTDLERSGTYVVERHERTLGAYSTWTKDDDPRPVIVLGNRHQSATERTFSLVRELGNLIMHNGVDMEQQPERQFRQFERQDDRFATYFLMPEREFAKDVGKISDRSDPSCYLDLKIKYRVPLRFIMRACRWYGLVSKADWKRFILQMDARYGQGSEPLDDKIVPFKPSRLRHLLDFVSLKERFDYQQLLKDCCIDKGFIPELFGMQDNNIQADLKAFIDLDRIL